MATPAATVALPGERNRGWIVANDSRQRLVRAHRQDRTGHRDEGGLEAGRGRGEDRDEEQHAEHGAHDGVGEGGEDIVGGVRVAEAHPLSPTPENICEATAVSR